MSIIMLVLVGAYVIYSGEYVGVGVAIAVDGVVVVRGIDTAGSDI